MAREWPYFLLDRLRYRGHDLTIVWDRPDGQVRYDGYPEGFSLYIDGALAFTRADARPRRVRSGDEVSGPSFLIFHRGDAELPCAPSVTESDCE